MATADAAIAGARTVRRRFLRGARLNVNIVTLTFSCLWLAAVLLAALLPGVIAPGDHETPVPTQALAAPGSGLLLGADVYGRSIAALLIHGARPAVIIGLMATAIGALGGATIGLIAGYFGGWLDMVIGRLIDVLMCFPGVLLALVITSALGATMANLILAVGIATLPGFARVMRGQVLTVRSRLYVEAARSTGLSPARILARHILPNALAPTVVLATVSVGTAIVVAASLSFLGLAPRTAIPDWGQLLASGQPYLSTAWWISTFPGIVLTLTVIAVSLAGDWLRDRLDID